MGALVMGLVARPKVVVMEGIRVEAAGPVSGESIETVVIPKFMVR